MKLDVLMLISAFLLAFVHPDAAQVAATAVLLLLVTRIERGRRARKTKRAPALSIGEMKSAPHRSAARRRRW